MCINNHFLILLYITHAGTVSYRKPLNLMIWSHCYLEFAYQSPPFYPSEFEKAATAILAEMNMTQQDINISNAPAVYWHLCSIII